MPEKTINYSTGLNQINFINENAITQWIKSITHQNQTGTVLTAGLKDRNYINANRNAIAAMLVNGYIRANIHAWLAGFKDTDMITAAGHDGAYAGALPYRFNLDKIPPELNKQIVKMNDYLRDIVNKYIDDSIAQHSGNGYIIDIKVARQSLPDFATVLARSKFNTQMPQPNMIFQKNIQND